MRRVLVIRFSSLGDILLTFPCLSFLASQGCEIHYLTKESFRPLLEMAAGANSQLRLVVHTIPNHATFKELVAKASDLKSLGFDFVLDLHRNLRSRVAAFVIGRPFARVWKFRFKESFLFVFRGGAFRKLGFEPITRPGESVRVAAIGLTEGFSKEVWESVAYTSLLKRLGEGVGASAGSSGSGGVSSRFIGASEQEKSRRILEELACRFSDGFVCIASESAWIQKEWPADRFVALAKQIAARGLGVVWIGLREVPHGAHFDGAVDLTKRLSLFEVATVLRDAKTLVCNDSGLMHLSEAVGTPVVAIFGPTTRELGFAPRLRDSQVVEAELWCRPCSKTGRLCIRPIARRKCLTDVSVASAWGAVEKVLGGRAEGRLS